MFPSVGNEPTDITNVAWSLTLVGGWIENATSGLGVEGEEASRIKGEATLLFCVRGPNIQIFSGPQTGWDDGNGYFPPFSSKSHGGWLVVVKMEVVKMEV